MLDELRDIVLTNQRALLVMGVFIALDVITGVLRAVVEHELSSTKMKEGLFRKALEIILVIFGVFLDFLLEVNYVANAATVALVAMEGVSILENIGQYIPLPDILKKTIAGLSDRESEEEDEEDIEIKPAAKKSNKKEI